MDETGIVKVWKEDRGFGFVVAEAGDDVFVHARQVRTKHHALIEGERVRFRREQTSRGVQAFDVTPVTGPEVVAEPDFRWEAQAALSDKASYREQIEAFVAMARQHGWLK